MIYGYSERGIFNSIIYYLYYKNLDLIGEFLKLLGVDGFTEKDRFDFTFLNEQSFSKFGDNDLTIIVNEKNTENKFVVFIEGKRGVFSLEKEFQEINNIFKNRDKLIEQNKKKLYTSNLFIQLYFKCLLPKKEYIETTGVFVDDRFKGFFRENRKIGTTETVLKGYNLIKDAKEYYYVAIIPKQQKDIKLLQDFFTDLDLLKNENIKCAFWQDIEAFFMEKNATEIIENFKYNENQIYKVEKQ